MALSHLLVQLFNLLHKSFTLGRLQASLAFARSITISHKSFTLGSLQASLAFARSITIFTFSLVFCPALDVDVVDVDAAEGVDEG